MERYGDVTDVRDLTAKNEQALVEPGRNCWRVERANRATLIIDAADYYRIAMDAMLEAKSQIILIGWDIDTRVRLIDGEHPSGAPTALGPLLTWIADRRPELDIYILPWDHGLISVPGRGTTFFRLLRWGADKNIHLKWDSTHPLDGSHHSKLLIVDDAMAFCGGIDIAGSRWDTRKHKDDEPGRKRPFTGRHYQPWHDAIMAMDGEAARALGEHGRERWRHATKEKVSPPCEVGDPWPKTLTPTFRDVDIAIARTRGKAGEISEVREIEALFIDLIAAAKRFVYVENQYFSSRTVAEAIGKRLEEADPPEFVIVNPKTGKGWLDEGVMGPARYELMRALEKKDKKGRLRIYWPVTEGGQDIYVHAKIMIVDDAILRVGSANFNNRSMGLDSECDIMIEGEREEVRRLIAAVRTDLMAEHLHVTKEEVAACFERTGSLIETVETLRGSGRTLVPLEPEDPGTIMKKMARSEALDPEAAGELFEARARPGLLAHLPKRKRSRG